MSISTITLQRLTVRALEGMTLAEEIVSEPVDPLSDDYTMKAHPILAVFTGVDTRPQIDGRDMLGANRTVELSIQIYCPAAVGVEVNGNLVDITTRSGGGGDLIVGMIERQVERALLFSDTPAAVLWRRLVSKIEEAHSQPYLFEMTKGVRLVAQEILFAVDCGKDPSFGVKQQAGDFWYDVLAFFDADPMFGPVSAWIRSEIEGPAGALPGRSAQADIGTTETAARFLSLRPLVDTTAPGTEFTITNQPGSPVVVDETLAGAVLPPEDPG